jgi:hypothetical protein
MPLDWSLYHLLMDVLFLFQAFGLVWITSAPPPVSPPDYRIMSGVQQKAKTERSPLPIASNVCSILPTRTIACRWSDILSVIEHQAHRGVPSRGIDRMDVRSTSCCLTSDDFVAEIQYSLFRAFPVDLAYQVLCGDFAHRSPRYSHRRYCR